MSSVERLFHHLVQVLAAEDPERLTGPIQVSELYQSILPYRTYKKVLQFDTNQDYEMAILQLLAGEGGYASVEPIEVRNALIKEVKSINPNPGTFRDYAAARVLFDQDAVRSTVEGAIAYAPPAPAESHDRAHDPYAPPTDPSPTAEPPGDDESADALQNAVDQHRTGTDAVHHSQPPQAPRFVAADSAAPFAPATSLEEDADVCPFCDQTLPTGRKVIFCPFCGGRVVPRKCDQCGDELENEWRFCPACGTTASDG